jgi:hypothetical protein
MSKNLQNPLQFGTIMGLYIVLVIPNSCDVSKILFCSIQPIEILQSARIGAQDSKVSYTPILAL